MGEFEPTQVAPLFRQIVTLFTHPASNLPAALALYGVLVLIVLIILVVAIVVIMGTPEDEYYEDAAPDFPQGGFTDQGGVPDGAQEPVKRRIPPAASFPVLVLLVFVIWVLAGYTTTSSDVCRNCHVKTAHDSADPGRDLHAGKDCVACHESQRGLGRYTAAVPARILHYVDGLAKTRLVGYGTVSSSACLSCHDGVRGGVTLDRDTGIRMSHAEPLRASAACLDCHTPQSGTVTARTVGMNACLRCHDAKTASAACTTCHDGKTSAAARARSVQQPRALVAQVNCGGCHDQKVECDSCHGTRMPHTVAFKGGAHARAAVVDFWYNGGQTCSKCHTPTRRSCQKCHGALLGRGHGNTNSYTHQLAQSSIACNTCHQKWAITPARDFCKDVCHTPTAIKESPR